MAAAIHMQAFRVAGKFRMGHITTPFTMETIANDEAGARDRILATIGSRHRANRHQIWIAKVDKIAAGAATDLTIEKRLALVK